eukprot:GABV01011829.1.p1 GENE.GABV01011829.1~~GABV01011829.1.p1  ORF type:complete len:118 (+),score=10.71 GABV01011829.1:35-388(+)
MLGTRVHTDTMAAALRSITVLLQFDSGFDRTLTDTKGALDSLVDSYAVNMDSDKLLGLRVEILMLLASETRFFHILRRFEDVVTQIHKLYPSDTRLERILGRLLEGSRQSTPATVSN